MKTTKIFWGFILVTCILLGSQGKCQAMPITLWQIGEQDFSHNEAPANAVFHDQFIYSVNPNNPIDTTPNAPFYLSNVNLFDIDPNRPARDTTPRFGIAFELDEMVYDVEFDLGRWGSETTRFGLFDGNGALIKESNILLAGDGEDVYKNHNLLLGNLGPGSYRIGLGYAGDGANDGHYIDYIRLSGSGTAPVPEPGTMALMGFGLSGMGFLKRKKRFTKK